MLKTAAQGITGALVYQGTWNASTNTPTLASGVGTKGYYYVVSVAGSTNLDGITDWQIGDWAVFNGTAWQKIDNTDAVTSVNGQTGTVVLGVANIAGAVPNTVNVLASGLLTGGGALTGNVTIGLTSVPSANVSGLGTMATQNANAVVITGGTINSATQTNGKYTNANITSVAATFPNSFLANSAVTLGNTSVSLGGSTATIGNLTLTNVTISTGSVNVTAANVVATTNANATFATSSLLLVPAGYINVNLNGTVVRVPYYST